MSARAGGAGLGARDARLLLAPAALTILLLMAVPLGIAALYSVMTADTYGGVRWPLSADAYLQLAFERDFDGQLVPTNAYLAILWRSAFLAVLTALLCLAIGLPVAWFIVCQPPGRRLGLLFLVTLPFWINTLIRTYCWVLILRDKGLANAALAGLGLPPLGFLYTDGAILLGLVYTFLPFMVLPIYATLERVDKSVVEAAFDLHATRLAVFRRIVWPLARPGAVAGALLVLAPALGSFLAPDLLGGGRKLMLGSLIQLQFTSSRNWPFGAALATLVTAAVLLAMLWQARAGGRPAAGLAG